MNLGKITTAAIREYKTTALTKAFVIGTFVLPLVIWVLIIVVQGTGILNSKKEPMQGTVAVIDQTDGDIVAAALLAAFDPAEQERRADEMREEIRKAVEETPASDLVSPEQLEQGLEMAQAYIPGAQPAEVTIEVLPDDADLEAQRERIGSGALRVLVRADEASMRPWVAVDAEEFTSDGYAATRTAGAALPDGVFSLLQAPDIDIDHARRIEREVERAITEERMRRAGIDPEVVQTIRSTQPRGQAMTLEKDGTEKDAAAGFRKALPFIFMMLLFTASITGGQYLLMGTLEEKSSRVMEVVLSAISPRELLVGKLLGQGLVGLTTLAVYVALGLGVADQFNMTGNIPFGTLPWLVVYFVMAYAFFGALMLAVGSAVTEIREAQSLQAPVMMLMMLPFILLVPVLENPSGIVARVGSWIPPITPFIMVMRMSDVAHAPPLWELLATTVLGFAAVAVVVWIAAKIFRVGVLMYGKPPSFLELLKWIRYA